MLHAVFWVVVQVLLLAMMKHVCIPVTDHTLIVTATDQCSGSCRLIGAQARRETRITPLRLQ
ncbi:MAG TPA: hypothetical protein PK580_05005 [Nitrosomonas halophila]|nr:hypothetical protein [Nitrosomonas halophila]